MPYHRLPIRGGKDREVNVERRVCVPTQEREEVSPNGYRDKSGHYFPFDICRVRRDHCSHSGVWRLEKVQNGEKLSSKRIFTLCTSFPRGSVGTSSCWAASPHQHHFPSPLKPHQIALLSSLHPNQIDAAGCGGLLFVLSIPCRRV